MGSKVSKNVRRPQAPKRRNYVAKNVGKFNRPQTFRDRTKYDRYEDYLKDQLDDMVDDLGDDESDAKKAEFKAKLKGEEYDPDLRKEWEDYLDRGAMPGIDDLEDWESDYLDDGYDDYDY